ncbi:csn protein [Gorgonomyces haynaldii]|nr:csn protein [Gorgonomyces haynaldii]
MFLLMLHVQAGLSQCQKSIVEQITNIYENGQLDFAWDYCENLYDGRGYTAGIIGFCTGTGDALELIELYNKMPGQTGEFKSMMKALRYYGKNGLGYTSKIKGYCSAFRKASKNNVFRKAQVQILNNVYYNPSQALAQKYGLKLPVSLGQFYDTAIQHGMGGDYDSLNQIAERVTAKSPANGGDEKKWLQEFLAVRKDDLCNPANQETQEVWCQSVSRVTSYEYVLKNSPSFTDTAYALDNDGKPVTVKCNLNLEN